ncbi:uncharacterized protein LOC118184394 [Stegodyphus dumicola]|uniref:uncharacterized protein LOC118184394 n=1 Tax=Stegodyphus dumicola TaxID=202533 RepID=UPI0015A8897D|nr:uncharacterized protein LOC118184394 [Stegodyphus dumicola]
MLLKAIVFVLAIVSFGATRASAGTRCNETVVIHCLHAFQQFLVNLDIFQTTEVVEYELNRLCEEEPRMMECFEKNIYPCSKSKQYAIREDQRAKILLLEEICDKNSANRKGFVSYTVCRSNEEERLNNCTLKYNIPKRWSPSGNWSEEENRKRCCILEGVKECNRKATAEKCGEEAAAFVEKAFMISFEDDNMTFCNNFDPNPAACLMYSTGSSLIQGLYSYIFYFALFMFIRQINLVSNR